MTPQSIERAKLSEELRVDWINTVMAIVGTEPQRRAFIDGFNGYGLPRHFSQQMHRQHELGRRVHRILHGPNPSQDEKGVV